MLDITLWAAQGFLALFFFAAGLPKLFGRGIERWAGFGDLPRGLVIIIGLSEVVGAVALVLPPLVGTVEWTTPLAAIGIAVISLMASGFHIRAAATGERADPRVEWLCALETALWASLAGSIAVGRWAGMSSGPSLPPETLIVVIAVIIPAAVVTLVLVTRRPIAPPSADGSPHRAAAL